jgi:hypothetical protein
MFGYLRQLPSVPVLENQRFPLCFGESTESIRQNKDQFPPHQDLAWGGNVACDQLLQLQ